MKVLLVGCTGFIGRSLVRQLVRDGHDCTVLIRSHYSPLPGHYPPKARLSPYDTRPTDVDAVINLAGEPVPGRWNKAKMKLILDSRVDATKELVDWMSTLKNKPKVFLSGSAVGFYGDRGDEPLTEHAGPDPARRFRSQVCILWEQEANRARTLGLRVVNLRIGNVMDLSGGFLGKMVPMLGLSPFIVPYTPKSYLPWISLEDAVAIIEYSMTHEDVTGPVNLVAPVPATCGEFFHVLSPLVKRKVFGRVPNILIKIALGKFSQALLESQKVLPEKILFDGYLFKDPELGECLPKLFANTQKVNRKRPVRKRSPGKRSGG